MCTDLITIIWIYFFRNFSSSFSLTYSIYAIDGWNMRHALL